LQSDAGDSIGAATGGGARNELDDQQEQARTWFETLRDRLCAEFEAIEREAGGDAAFVYTRWDRLDPDGSPGS